MGIPQGSVIAPVLLNILIYDLPRKLSNKVEVVQYADDICMWMPVMMKKETPLRSLNYTKTAVETQTLVKNHEFEHD